MASPNAGSTSAQGVDIPQLKGRPDTLCSATLLPRAPFGYAEWITLGSIAGGVGGFIGGGIAGEMELGAIFAPLLALPFAIVGGACGFFAKKHGWRVVRPVCWAITGGILHGIDSPYGWILAGAIGGVISGVRYRSLPKLAVSATMGGLAGTTGWLIVTGYLISVVWILDSKVGVVILHGLLRRE